MSIAIGTPKTLESGDREPDDRRRGRRSNGGPRAPRPSGNAAADQPIVAHYRHEERERGHELDATDLVNLFVVPVWYARIGHARPRSAGA